jgi:predicted Zn-dependent peptidase
MTTYGERVLREEVGPCTLLVLPTGAKDVVSVRLSIDTHPDFAAGEELVQDVTAVLLQKGTRRRDRFEVASILEDRGARLSFSGSGVRVRASGRMLRDDVGVIVRLAGEMLTEPAFDEEELSKTRHRLKGSVLRSASDTGHRAAVELARHALEPGHPGFMTRPDEDLAALESLDGREIRAFHASRFRGPVRCVAVGDVDAAALREAIEKAFSAWPSGPSRGVEYPDSPATVPGTVRTPIPDRPNLDVVLGHSLSTRRDDPEFDALHVGVFALGGNFSARLMARVRDELGLTYGIGSSLSGIGIHHGGLWQTSLTLSADRLSDGIDATRRELDRFVSEAVAPGELDEKKETLAGRFVVGLATTGGVAQALLSAEENGFGPGYLDDYPRRVAALTPDLVNRVVRERLDVSRLFVSIAGSVPG